MVKNNPAALRFLGLSLILFCLFMAWGEINDTRKLYRVQGRHKLSVYIGPYNRLLPLKKVDVKGFELSHGKTGELLYRPACFSDAILYDCLSGAGEQDVWHPLIGFFLGAYIFILSFFIGQKGLFAESNYLKFGGLILFLPILLLLKMYLTRWIGDRFYEQLDSIVRLSSPSSDIKTILIVQFALSFFTFIFSRGTEVQKEQELTI